ncbi:MAG: Gfo/Idh/MocA family oxidoreductase [Kofleriaceae bacterium]
MKILLCGFGSIGRRHFANARAMVGNASWTVVEPMREAWVSEPDVTFVPDLAGVSGNFDVAFVCSPTALHGDQLVTLAGRAAAFFIEKPLAHDRSSLAAIRAAFDGRRAPTMVGCNYRFEPGLQRVAELLQSSTIGRIVSVRAEFGQWLPSWRPKADYRLGYAAKRETGGGVILDRIHELDYVTWLFGAPTRVEAMSGKLSQLEIETEDTAELLLRFPSGTIGSVHVDYIRREYLCRLEVTGDRGSIEWRFRPTSVRILRESGSWESAFEDPMPDVNAMYVAELRYFFDMLARGAKPMNDIAEAGATLEVALTALEQR